MTEERIAELGKIDVKSLPLNQAIKYVKGKGERTFIFSVTLIALTVSV